MPSIIRLRKTKKTISKIEKPHDMFYNSKAWKSIRTTIIERDKGLCFYCLKNKRITEGKVVDHVLPRRLWPDLELSTTNLVYCCSTCHNRKRYIESTTNDRLQLKLTLQGVGLFF